MLAFQDDLNTTNHQETTAALNPTLVFPESGFGLGSWISTTTTASVNTSVSLLLHTFTHITVHTSIRTLRIAKNEPSLFTLFFSLSFRPFFSVSLFRCVRLLHVELGIRDNGCEARECEMG